jgi:hypothetical protein
VVRTGSLRLSAWIACALASIASIAACRAVAGIKEIAYEPLGTDGGPEGGLDGSLLDAINPDSCDAAAPPPLFSLPDDLVQLAVVSSQVFVGTGLGIEACGTAGCGTIPFQVAPPAGAPTSLTWGSFALAPALAYYSLTGNASGAPDGGVLPGVIHSVHLDGSSDTPFIDAVYPYLLAVAAGYLFWTDDPFEGGEGTTMTPSTVYRCTLAGCPSGTPWMTGIGHTYAIFADANNLYVLANDPSSASTAASLFSCSLATSCAGTPPHVVLTGVDSAAPFSFASDGTFVYGAYAAVTGIVRVAVTGGTPMMIAGNADAPVSLTLDPVDLDLYWTTAGGSVYRATPGGADLQLLACNQSAPSLIATDATSIYFANVGGTESAVERLPKP